MQPEKKFTSIKTIKNNTMINQRENNNYNNTNTNTQYYNSSEKEIIDSVNYKGFNTFLGVFSIVTAVLFFIAPIAVLGTAINDSFYNSGDFSNTTAVKIFFELFGILLIIMSIYMLVKDKISSLPGKILILVGGTLVLLLGTTLMGYISGILVLIGGILLLTSNKLYNIRIIEK